MEGIDGGTQWTGAHRPGRRARIPRLKDVRKASKRHRLHDGAAGAALPPPPNPPRGAHHVPSRRDHHDQRRPLPQRARPIIPFIEGDGTGPDIWRASVRVFDAAVEKAYGGKRKIHWHEVLAGEKAFKQTGNWLPDETLDDFRKYLVGIKGPLTTPSAAASARSTSRSARSSTSTSASAPCAGSRACPARSSARRTSTW
jgi:hypothetical protein